MPAGFVVRTPSEPPSSGWRLPTTTPSSHETQGLLLLGLGFAATIAWGVNSIAGAVWSACDSLPPGGGFGLLFGLFPLVTVAAWATFATGIAFTRRRRPLHRILVGSGMAIVVGVVAVMLLVPRYGGTTQVIPLDPLFPECGANGLPIWWPGWLPS